MSNTVTGREGATAQKTVVVLGLARSGTSVTTGVLEALGVDMGPPSWPTDWNPKGNFEDENFGKLHKAILNAAEPGKTYFNPPPPELILAQKENFARQIQNLIAEKSHGKSLWGWKHPDTIMMIDLYMPYLVNPRFVVVFRNPLGTAQSTVEHTRRFQDQVDFWRALKLVHYYHEELLRFIDAHPELPKIFVSFEDLVAEPLKEARRLADFLGVEFTEDKMRQVERLVIPREKIAAEKTRAKTLMGGKIPRLLKKKLLPFFRAHNKIEG